MACPAPALTPRRRRRRRAATQPARSGTLLLLCTLVVMLGYALRTRYLPAIAAAPADPAADQVDEQVRAALPAGAVVLQAIPLVDGSMALAWRDQVAARTGVALAEPGGAYRLWVASTQRVSDVAAHTEIDVIDLPGLEQPVLVSTYTTDDCCSWVHLFALGPSPRLLFESPTHTSRMLASGIVVRESLPGEYPGGPAAHVHTYSWDGKSQFRRTGLAVAPQYYFPLARNMKWTYRSGDALVDRWVQGTRTTDADPVYVVRSVSRRGAAVLEEPEAAYTYAPGGEVLQQAPGARTVLGASPALGSSWPGAKVEAVRELMRTPAGEFRNVLVVTEGAVTRYYAPDVGLIREERPGHPPLELIAYGLPN